MRGKENLYKLLFALGRLTFVSFLNKENQPGAFSLSATWQSYFFEGQLLQTNLFPIVHKGLTTNGAHFAGAAHTKFSAESQCKPQTRNRKVCLVNLRWVYHSNWSGYCWWSQERAIQLQSGLQNSRKVSRKANAGKLFRKQQPRSKIKKHFVGRKNCLFFCIGGSIVETYLRIMLGPETWLVTNIVSIQWHFSTFRMRRCW